MGTLLPRKLWAHTAQVGQRLHGGACTSVSCGPVLGLPASLLLRGAETEQCQLWADARRSPDPLDTPRRGQHVAAAESRGSYSGRQRLIPGCREGWRWGCGSPALQGQGRPSVTPLPPFKGSCARNSAQARAPCTAPRNSSIQKLPVSRAANATNPEHRKQAEPHWSKHKLARSALLRWRSRTRQHLGNR